MPVVLYFPWAKATGNYNKAFATPFSNLFRPAVGHFVVQFPIFIFYITAFFLPVLLLLVIWASNALAFLGRPDAHIGGVRSFLPMSLAWSLALASFLGAHALSSLKWPWVLTRLGAISYGIYLLHGFAISWAGFLSNHFWIQLPLVLLMTVGVSEILHRWVELPMVALGRRPGTG